MLQVWFLTLYVVMPGVDGSLTLLVLNPIVMPGVDVSLALLVLNPLGMTVLMMCPSPCWCWR